MHGWKQYVWLKWCYKLVGKQIDYLTHDTGITMIAMKTDKTAVLHQIVHKNQFCIN